MTLLKYNICIIGGGCLGSSALFELANLGQQNLALIDERNGSLGATFQSGGMLRVFHENIAHLELALENHKIISSNNSFLLPEQQGHLYFFNKSRFSQYSEQLATMLRDRYPFEVFSAESGQRQFPEFIWSKDEWAIYEPLAGHLMPDHYVSTLQSVAQKKGAQLHRQTRILRMSQDRDRFRLFARRDEEEMWIECQHLVLAGGARLIERLPDLGLCLPLQERSIDFFIGKNAGLHALPNYFERESLNYARLGRCDEIIVSEPLRKKIRPEIWSGALQSKSAKDCYAPSRLGYAGSVSGFVNLSLATGWGGTGFKFASAIGKRIARSIANTNSQRRFYV